MSDRYPAFRGPRVPIAVAVAEGGGPVAGRLATVGDDLVLEDPSGTVVLDGDPPSAPGDLVSGRLVASGGRGGHRLDDVVVHARATSPSPEPDLRDRLPRLEARAAMIRAAREWFAGRGFVEVETPARVVNPGLEPHLRAFPASIDRSLWLITSPELHLKRLLASGAERIVEFARAFRDDEHGPWHRPEFTLVEWYRAWSSLGDLERDCEHLVAAMIEAVPGPLRDASRAARLAAPFERTTVRQALRDRTGLDLATLGDRDDLARAVAERGHPVAEDDDWDAVFFRVWISEVEPHLGRERPVFVHRYPASQAALARTTMDADGFPVAERFELYVDGVEIANAFDELNDPVEQRLRHESDRVARRTKGAPDHPLDESFLAALESGMPPSAGIALGLDRLVAVLLGMDGIANVQAFPGD